MRYSRQEKINFIPKGFQKTIKDKKIILVGCGGVGSVLGELLARGGFLNLVLIDNDLIDETNLQRQIYFEEELGEPKVKALKEHLRKINSKIRIEYMSDLLDEKYINEICRDSDLIIDCSDNFEVRELINTYCERERKNWIYNGAVKTEAISCIFYGEDQLFRKVFDKSQNGISCCDVGVLASTTFTSASLCYNQVLKYFLGLKEYKLIKLDLWTNKLHEVSIK